MKEGASRPSNFLDLRQRFESNPGAVALFPDSHLATILLLPILCRFKAAHLWAELWLRRWLYEDRFPEPLDACLILRGWSSEFRDAFDSRAVPLRQPKSDSKPRHHEDLRTPEGLDEQEQVVWERLRARLTAFIECDGLLALVPLGSGNDKDGVVVPFKLEPGEGFVDADDAPLTNWQCDLERFLRSYTLGMKVRVSAVFPVDAQPERRSFGVALAVARERLAGSLPWFFPLSVLATGKVADGRVESVDGLPAKQALAGRLNCALFVGPSASADGANLPISPGTTLRETWALVRDRLQKSAGSVAIAKEVFRRCKGELQLAHDSGVKVSMVRYQELERLLGRACATFAANSATDEDAKLAQVLLRNVRASANGGSGFGNELEELESFVLRPYRNRRLFGRNWFVSQLNQFVRHSPGGLSLLTGKSGFGKTALLVHWLEDEPFDGVSFIHFFRAERDNLRSVPRFFARLAKFLENVLPEEYLLGAQQDEAEAEEAVHRLLHTYADVPEKFRPRLLLVIDGLDEASQRYFECFLPFTQESWPSGLHVVASVRTSGGGQNHEIRSWVEAAKQRPLDLTSLDEAAIQKWLRASRAPLCELAGAPAFVAALLDRTDGCALYIEHLLADLAEATDLQTTWQQRLGESQAPKGYVNFIALQYKSVFEKKSEVTTREDLASFQQLLELLTVAEGPLDETDVRILLGTSLLPELKELNRWIATWEGSCDRGHLVWFSNQLIREALEKMSLPLQSAKSQLLQYCGNQARNWATCASPYVLRHFGSHLAKEASWDELSELVLNIPYRRKLQAVFADQPDLPLRLLRNSLDLALARKDWAGVARMMVTHAEFRHRAMQYQPRRDEAPDVTAFEMAKLLDHSDPARAALWRLLRAWCFVWQRRPADVEPIRCELAMAELVPLSSLGADIAADLLARVFDSADRRLEKVAEGLLDDEARQHLVGLLAKRGTAGSFEAAGRVLATIRRSRRKDSNRYYDWAAQGLAIELARAKRWPQVWDLLASLLPRQSSLSSLEVGRVAAANGETAKLWELREWIEKLAVRCATAADLKQKGMSSEELRPRQGTPADRLFCRSTQARLDALLAQVLELPEAAQRLDQAFSQAESLRIGNHATRPELYALLSVVETVLIRPEVKQLTPIVECAPTAQSSSPVHRRCAKRRHPVRRYLARLIRCWRGIKFHDHDTFSAVAHGLVSLIEVAINIRSKAPEACPTLQRWIPRWASQLREEAAWLAPSERDDLWLRIVRDTTGAEVLHPRTAVATIKRVQDTKKRSRAVAALVERLCADGRHQLADKIGKSEPSLHHSIRLAVGVATLDYDAKKATQQIIVRLLPNPFRDPAASVQRSNLLAELGAATAANDPTTANQLLTEALTHIDDCQLNTTSRVRFMLDVAEAAWRGRVCTVADDTMARASEIAMKEARRLRNSIEYSPKSPAPEDIHEVVELLCALALAQKRLSLPQRRTAIENRRTWEQTLQVARSLARTVPGLSAHTAALAEVAEAYRLLGRTGVAREQFAGMHKFINERLPSFGKGRTRRERIVCLGELALGLMKAGFFEDAKRIENEFYPRDKRHAPLRDATALRAVAWMRAWDHRLGQALPILRKIEDPEVRARATRDVSVCLAMWGRLNPAIFVANMIDRARLKQKTLHRIIEAAFKSENLSTFQQDAVLSSLLWPCSETFYSAYVALAHVVRYRSSTAPQIFSVVPHQDSPPAPPDTDA